jgi:predicted DNA-binding transcriptional regulator AlpA
MLSPIITGLPVARALYPIKEAEVILSISHAQIYRLINGGRLDARKIGSRTFITAASIEAFLTSLPKLGAAA